MARKDDLMRTLNLADLTGEGGFYRFLHLFGDESGIIVYMITKESFSRLHRLTKDEIWIYLEGGRAEQVEVSEDGSVKKRILDKNNRFSLVKAGDGQATSLLSGEYALFATVMSPHYEDDDYSEYEESFILSHPELGKYL